MGIKHIRQSKNVECGFCHVVFIRDRPGRQYCSMACAGRHCSKVRTRSIEWEVDPEIYWQELTREQKVFMAHRESIRDAMMVHSQNANVTRILEDALACSDLGHMITVIQLAIYDVRELEQAIDRAKFYYELNDLNKPKETGKCQ